MSASREVLLLLSMIEEGYKRKAWHGPNLRGTLRSLTAKQAARRPGRRRHNIWEIVVHCAYWKYAVWRRISGEKKGSFPLQGSNWFVRPLINSEKKWREDIQLLNAMHSRMCERIGALKPADLRKVPKGSKVTIRSIVSGIAMHDVYHAGQIQLLKRMMLDA